MDELSPEQHALLWALLWIVAGALIGFAAGKFRGQEAAGAFLGGLLGPLGWLLTLGLFDRRPRCPECRGLVIEGATRCCHCGVDLGH